MTRLYLIRHGQAFCNTPPYGAVAGPKGDQGLTPLGREQAAHLRDRLAATGEIAADVLIASTLPRAVQTAEIIAPALALPVRVDDEVQEMSFGELDGLPWADVKDTLPDHRVEPFRPLGPGGENWPQFQLRAAHALDRIVTEHDGQQIVVVCHGGIVDASVGYFFGINTLRPGQVGLFTSNTSITVWEHRSPLNWGREPNGGEPGRWRLVKYNDDLHIRDIGMAERLSWVRLAKQPPSPGEQPAAPLAQEDEDD
ncbi:MAG: histidine phosphatase family protein [Ktedonobacterales bacterium]